MQDFFSLSAESEFSFGAAAGKERAFQLLTSITVNMKSAEEGTAPSPRSTAVMLTSLTLSLIYKTAHLGTWWVTFCAKMCKAEKKTTTLFYCFKWVCCHQVLNVTNCDCNVINKSVQHPHRGVSAAVQQVTLTQWMLMLLLPVSAPTLLLKFKYLPFYLFLNLQIPGYIFNFVSVCPWKDTSLLFIHCGNS